MVFSGGLPCENSRDFENRIINLCVQFLSCGCKTFMTVDFHRELTR